MEDPGLNGRILLKWTFERLYGGIDWIDPVKDSDMWRAFVNTVMNLRVPQNAGRFLSSFGCVGFSGRSLLHGVSFSLRIYISQLKLCNFCTVKVAYVTSK